jgi:hypothetical protein
LEMCPSRNRSHAAIERSVTSPSCHPSQDKYRACSSRREGHRPDHPPQAPRVASGPITCRPGDVVVTKPTSTTLRLVVR